MSDTFTRDHPRITALEHAMHLLLFEMLRQSADPSAAMERFTDGMDEFSVSYSTVFLEAGVTPDSIDRGFQLSGAVQEMKEELLKGITIKTVTPDQRKGAPKDALDDADVRAR